MPTEAQEWADAHRDELHSALHDHQASEMIRTLVDVRVPHRHSVVEEIWKWHNEDTSVEEAVETAHRLGGGFFQKVFAGEYADAYLHADGNNQRIIELAYDRQFIADNADDGYTARVVRERWSN